MLELKPESRLKSGEYVVKRVLGQGGFGITYLAEQVSLKRMVAIKEFFMAERCGREKTGKVTVPTTGSTLQVERYRAKFLKEAQTMASLDHPNIVNVIGVFEQNDTVYYVMPYMTGGSLSDLVKAKGRLSEERALRYIRQIASALKYMHEQRHLCHYDVKPANILLNSYDNAVLIDFGISKNYDSKGNETSSTPIAKSPGFAPLEQYQEMVKEFSPASDVYALGATLYYLVMGKTPPTAVSISQGEDLTFDSRVSQGTRRLIENAMQISSRKRPQSVAPFMAASSSPSDATLPANEATLPAKEVSQPKSTDNNKEILKKESSIQEPVKKYPTRQILLSILGILLIPTLIFLIKNSSGKHIGEEYVDAAVIDSLQISPVYTAKHAFECLKNGDEEGFNSCLIEYDDEFSSCEATVPPDIYHTLLGDIHNITIDYESYHSSFNDTLFIEDRDWCQSKYPSTVKEAYFISVDGEVLTANLFFMKNSCGQWKMSIPLVSSN